MFLAMVGGGVLFLFGRDAAVEEMRTTGVLLSQLIRITRFRH